MFRKKSPPAPQERRSVRQQQSANVFSYYASRSPGETGSTVRRSQPLSNAPARRASAKRWLSYFPSMVAAAALVFCMVYVSTLSPQPKIQILGNTAGNTLVGGSEDYEYELQQIFGKSFTNRSKLLINTDKLAAEIRETFPELGEVSVILPLAGRRPIVEVSPAAPAIVLSGLEGSYVVDQKGRAIADSSDVPSSIRDPLPVIQDESGLPLERGKGVLPSETIAFVQEISGQFKAKNITIQVILLPTIANELHVRPKDKDYYVKFDLQGEGRLQAGSYIAVKEKLEKDKVTPREYIDVRVPEKAFYK